MKKYPLLTQITFKRKSIQVGLLNWQSLIPLAESYILKSMNFRLMFLVDPELFFPSKIIQILKSIIYLPSNIKSILILKIIL